MSTPVEPEAASDPAPFPRRFGERYALLKELGQGGMGTVFMAVSGTAGVSRVCALKIIREFEPGQGALDMTQRFLDEAKLVTQLSHDGLVYVFDFGVVNRRGYLAMEYVAGKTLTEVWNRCAEEKVGLPTGLVLYLVSELVAALGYAHRAGGLALVHRDISPSNLILAYTGGLKLIDFGLARSNSKVAQTATGINWGKVGYMSPEQYFGKPLDHRSDLFSAGVILWEILTGRQLFESVESRSRREIPPPSRFNSAVTPEVDRVLAKALAFDPSARFATGEEMSAALAAETPREAGRLAAAEFMERLFSADRQAETAEQQELLTRAAALGERMPDEAAGVQMQARDPMVGTTIAGRYYIRRRIGEGAMGRVYEGHHTGVGKRVAIKIARHTERRQANLVERFRREAQAAAQIGHPNIADVTDCGTTQAGDFFFVMELVEGVDVEKLIAREGPLPIERALVIAVQIARALEAAHEAGVIHRDLKPSNVMILRGREETDFVKVLDFGVAKFLRNDNPAGEDSHPEVTRPHAAVGTPRFMAPEQVGSRHPVDFRADIYGLGGILYAMLSGGHAPVEGDSIEAVWHRKLHDDPTPLGQLRRDVPADVQAIVMRCLARDPGARPPSMTVAKKDLVAALERGRAGASALLSAAIGPPISPPSRTEQLPRRRTGRAVLVAATAVVVAALAGAVWRLLPRAGVNPSGPAPTAPEPPRRLPAVTAAGPAPVTAAPTTSEVPKPTSVKIPRRAPATAAAKLVRAPIPPGESGSRPPAPAPLPADGILEEAEVLFQKGQLVAALTAAEKALRAGGGTRALLAIAKIHLATEDFAQAAAAYNEALHRDPGNEAARRGIEKVRAARAR